VAFVEALNLLYWAMRAVAYRRILMAIGMAGKVGVFFIIIILYVTPAAAGAIHSGYLPNGGFQWLLPKPWTSYIEQCTRHCHGASAGPSASEGGAFVFIAYFGIQCKHS
jgi:hypothetical protein